MTFDGLKYDEDEARGVLEAVLPAGYIASLRGMTMSDDALNAYRDAVRARERSNVAAFIRVNIDMQGLDFADAEDVAKWLEEKR